MILPLPKFLKKNSIIVFFLAILIQNLFPTNVKLVYIIFKQFDNQYVSSF